MNDFPHPESIASEAPTERDAFRYRFLSYAVESGQDPVKLAQHVVEAADELTGAKPFPEGTTVKEASATAAGLIGLTTLALAGALPYMGGKFVGKEIGDMSKPQPLSSADLSRMEVQQEYKRQAQLLQESKRRRDRKAQERQQESSAYAPRGLV